MKVQVDLLRAALDKLLDHVEEVQGGTVDVNADLYWFVPKGRDAPSPKEVVAEPEAEPTGLTLGSLEDDWAEVAAIGRGSKQPFGHGLVWASSILRAIGDRAP